MKANMAITQLKEELDFEKSEIEKSMVRRKLLQSTITFDNLIKMSNDLFKKTITVFFDDISQYELDIEEDTFNEAKNIIITGINDCISSMMFEFEKKGILTRKEPESYFLKLDDIISNKVKELAFRKNKSISTTNKEYLKQIAENTLQTNQILMGIGKTSDMIINAMGTHNQRSLNELIENKKLLQEFIELLENKEDTNFSTKIKKFFSKITGDVAVALIKEAVVKGIIT